APRSALDNWPPLPGSAPATPAPSWPSSTHDRQLATTTMGDQPPRGLSSRRTRRLRDHSPAAASTAAAVLTLRRPLRAGVGCAQPSGGGTKSPSIEISCSQV